MGEHDDYDRATGDIGAPVHIHRPHRIQLLRHVEPVYLRDRLRPLLFVAVLLAAIATAGMVV